MHWQLRSAHVLQNFGFFLSIFILQELQDICKWILNGNIPEVPSVVSGDFNHIDSEHPDEWNSFLSLLGVESTIQGKTTFVGPKGESSIDDVLVPTEYLQNSSLWPQVYFERNYQHSGHATIGVELRHRPSVSSTESFANHVTIPSNVYQPGKDLMDFGQAAKETDSVARLLRRLHSTQEISFRRLQVTHWQWYLSEPAAEKFTLYSLRKHIHSAKPLVHVRTPLIKFFLLIGVPKMNGVPKFSCSATMMITPHGQCWTSDTCCASTAGAAAPSCVKHCPWGNYFAASSLQLLIFQPSMFWGSFTIYYLLGSGLKWFSESTDKNMLGRIISKSLWYNCLMLDVFEKKTKYIYMIRYHSTIFCGIIVNHTIN